MTRNLTPSIKYYFAPSEIMPKIEVELSSDLNDRLANFVVKSRGSLYVQRSEVIVEAIKEYLDRNERKVQRSNG
jgi:metal-responsive CopG/Arc/MetJ family transcriptional regulator